MLKHIGAALFSISLLTAAACGGGDSCDKLSKEICSGKDEATCKKTAEWLDGEMVGPDDKKLSDGEAGTVCKMILEDKAALAAYTEQAQKELAGD